MSTSPSWFDQDKFSRLVKKVGTKTPAGQSAASQPAPVKIPSQPLVKEALLPESKASVKTSSVPIRLREAQLPEDSKPTPPLPAKPLLKEAPLAEEAKEEIPLPAKPLLKEAPLTEEAKEEPQLPAKPLFKEASLTEEAKEEPQLPAKPLLKVAPLPEEPKFVLPSLSSRPLLKEADLPPLPKPANVTKAPPLAEPPREKRLSQRLSLDPAPTPPLEPEPKLIPAPILAEAGKPEIAEEAPALPNAVSRPPVSAQRLMTSQPLSFIKKKSTTPLSFPKIETKSEPIRAPAPSDLPKPPPMPEGAVVISRTAALPAFKSLFQYEIPGGQGTIPGRPPGEAPPAKPALPAFTFQKPAAKSPSESLPPVADEEENVPAIGGVSAAAKLAEAAEAELSAETLAAEWGKTDNLQAEIDRITKERDDALAEVRQLREGGDKPGDSGEIETITRERNEVRSEYIKLRSDFEKLKQEKLAAPPEAAEPSPAPAGGNPELEQEIETLRAQLEDEQREINALRTSSADTDVLIEKLKEETVGVRNEVKKAQNEASVAQRGLALSQKALQETREALREASEGKKK